MIKRSCKRCGTEIRNGKFELFCSTCQAKSNEGLNAGAGPKGFIEPSDKHSSKSQRFGIWTILLLALACVPLSALLWGVAPYAAAIGGVFITAYLVSQYEDRKSGLTLLLSSGFLMIAISGAIFVALSLPAWLLGKLGILNF